MDQNNFGNLISRYLDGELSSEQNRLVEEQMAKDEHYREMVATFSKIKETTQQLEAPEPASWQQFDEQLWEKIDQKRPVSNALKRAASILVILSAAFATLLFQGPKSEVEKGVKSSISEVLEKIAYAKSRYENEITHKAIQVTADYPQYKVSRDLSGLSYANLNEEEVQFLLKNGFVVGRNNVPSFSPLYQENERRGIPSFITVEMVVAGFSHILARLRLEMEREGFLYRLSAFTDFLAQGLIDLHEQVPAEYEQASLRALAFVRVASVLIDSEQGVKWPSEILAKIEPQVNQELAFIFNGKKDDDKEIGIRTSPIFGYPIDYNRFGALWGEVDDSQLRRYYQTHTWYNRCIFRASEDNLSEMRSALLILMACIGRNADGIIIWEEIHRVLTALYGEPDDAHLLIYLKEARRVFGDTMEVPHLADTQKLQEFCRVVNRKHVPKIRSEVGLQRGLRIFGRRDIGVDTVLQQLCYPYVGERHFPRIKPSLIDIPVVMGYQKALDVAKNKEFFSYKGYQDKVERFHRSLRSELAGRNRPWRKGGLVGNAWLYEALMQPESKGYPAFSRSEAWNARKLTSIICGIVLDLSNRSPRFVGETTKEFYGAVDPYPEFYNRLVTKIKCLEEILIAVDYPIHQGPAQELIKYAKSLEQLSQAATRMLQNRPLNEQDQKNLGNFVWGWQGDHDASFLFDLSTIFYRNWTQFDDHLYVGVDSIRELWVAIPINGEVQLARGGVFSLHEFQSMKKLSQEQWREMEYKPGQASWMKEYSVVEENGW